MTRNQQAEDLSLSARYSLDEVCVQDKLWGQEQYVESRTVLQFVEGTAPSTATFRANAMGYILLVVEDLLPRGLHHCCMVEQG